MWGARRSACWRIEQVRKILKDKYRLSLDYNRAGSIEMVTTLDRAGQDFLFPSNQTALELFEGEEGSPEKSQIVFNTPIVLYTHAAVAEALTAEGVFSQSGRGAHRGHGTAGRADGVRRPVERRGPAGAVRQRHRGHHRPG